MDNKLSVIKSPVRAEFERFEALFDSALHTSGNVLLKQVLHHIKQRGGKRMRPVLVLLIAKAFGQLTDATYHAAVALELLHTASLVHDDVVDESDERRGQASVNAVYDNKISVLIGDYLFATCLIHACKTSDFRIMDAISRLGQDLSEGELLQLANVDSESFDEKVYFDVIRKKTAALFAACAETAALSVGAADGEVETARLLGEYIGICFQIRDDLFDYGMGAGIGKPVGNDMREGKLTLPAIYVLNRSDNKEMRTLAEAVKAGTIDEAGINRLVDFVKQNGGIEYAEQVMDSFRGRAEQLLSAIGDVKVKEALSTYLDYVIGRLK